MKHLRTLIIVVVAIATGSVIWRVSISNAATVKGDTNTATVEQRLLQDPNVLWVGTADSSGSWKTPFGVAGEGQSQNVAQVTPPTPWRGKALRVRSMGKDHPDSGDGRWGYDGRNTFAKMGISEQDEAYFRYYVWIPSNLKRQGKMPGLQGHTGNIWGPNNGGDIGTGDWGTRTMWKALSDPNKIGMITYLNVLYAGGAPKPSGYSTSIRYKANGADQVLNKGAWNYVEQRVKMNTPGQKNGIFEGWINGVKGVSLKDVEYRTHSGLHINQWNLVTFWGGPESDYATEPTEFYYDDFVISKAYIGPRQDGPAEPRPDLVITDVSTNPSNPAVGQPVTFSATVKNQGDAATPAGTVLGVRFDAPGGSMTWSDTHTASLAPGTSVTLTANGGQGGSTWTPTDPGSAAVAAIVDDRERILESNDSNNTFNKSVTVLAEPVLPSDLVVTDISWSPASPAPGDAVTFSATIKNQGQGATPADTIHGVSFWVNGAKLTWSDSHTAALAPGQSITVTANGGTAGSTWTAVSGDHEIEAFVDDLDRIPDESDESNNTKTETLHVSDAPPAPVRGDVNGDGLVDATDLSIVLTNYGRTNRTKSQGDLSGDGKVDALDLSQVLTGFGS